MNPTILKMISVIMPVYNGGKYLRESIQSILNQTYDDFELIIINDGSTDNSEQIIQSFTDFRIRYICNPTNLRLITTLNKGIELARGEFIARMDQDDISLPNRFQKQIDFFNINLDYGLVGTSVYHIAENYKKKISYHLDNESLKFALGFYCPFIHPSVMIRTSVLKQLEFFYDESYLHAEDFELWTRISKITKIANLSEPLIEYRIHDEQTSIIHKSAQEKISLIIREKYLNDFFKSFDVDFKAVFNLRTYHSIKLFFEFKKMYNLDKKHNFFGGDNFKRYLINKWKNLVLESTSIRFEILFFLFFSKISWQTNWTIRQLFSVTLKVFK